jgi:hypothetical protein
MMSPTACILIAALVTVAGARSVTTQPPFEGVVSIKVSDPDDGPSQMQYHIRNGAFRMELVSHDGEKSVWITDPRRRVIYIVTPAKQAYTEMTLPDDDPASAEKEPRITKTGRSETIAGHKCEQYHLKDEDGDEYDMCLARGLGSFFSAGGPMSAGEQAWARKLGDAFPLRFAEAGPSGMSWEVTRIERRPLDASLFAPPAGYKRVTIQ